MQTTDESISRVRIVTVDAGHEGQRIDNFLAGELKGVPRSLIYRVLRKGQVRVNKGRIKPEYRLRQGDQVRIPPVRLGPSATPRIPESVGEQLRNAVLFEDDEILVLDKPAGLAVHAGSGLQFGAIEALRALRLQLRFLELVHRLDRETSGCLLLAKSRPTLLALQEQLKSGQLDKRYLALTYGRWAQDSQTVDAPLRKNALSGGERMVIVSADGRSARTRFTVLARYADATLVEVLLETGRTHQIRVHAAHSGHPLAGDPKYGNEDFNKHLRGAGLRRMFLHAHRLGFTHPETGEYFDLGSPLPEALRELAQKLEQER